MKEKCSYSHMLFDLNIFFKKKFFLKQNKSYFYLSNSFLPKNYFFYNFFLDLSGFFKKKLNIFYFFRVGYLYSPLNVLVRSIAFKNCFDNWVFREFNEFFGTTFNNLLDKRNILLDYRVQENPLKKNFNNFTEISFDICSMDVSCNRTSFIEL